MGREAGKKENELHIHANDPMLNVMRHVIHLSVRILALAMTAVIVWGVIDVFYVLYERLTAPPRFLLEITDILATFGAFMAVVIAIEIFVNITIYLRDDIIHVKIVLATALMAVARKVIILDFYDTETMQIFALAALVIAISVGYWMVVVLDKQRPSMPPPSAHRSSPHRTLTQSQETRSPAIIFRIQPVSVALDCLGMPQYQAWHRRQAPFFTAQ